MKTDNACNRKHNTRRFAFTLTELVFVVVAFGFILGLATQVMRTHLEVNRRLTASAGRAAATQSFQHQVRADLLAASSFTVSTPPSDANLNTTTVTIEAPDGVVTYAFSRLDHADPHADREPGIDQVIVRTDAEGAEHRWTLPSQTVVVQPAATAPTRLLTLAFEDNGPRTAGFIRHERLELSLLAGGAR